MYLFFIEYFSVLATMLSYRNVHHRTEQGKHLCL